MLLPLGKVVLLVRCFEIYEILSETSVFASVWYAL